MASAFQAVLPDLRAAFAHDVRRDLALRPRQIQSKYLYDSLGSTLFEAICLLPWYKITRAERELLERRARDIVAALPDRLAFVELGGGNGEKLGILIEEFVRRGRRGSVHLIDISQAALEQSEQRLSRWDRVSAIARPTKRGCARPRRGGRTGSAGWFSSSAPTLATLIRRRPRTSCARFERRCGPATTCSWARIW